MVGGLLSRTQFLIHPVLYNGAVQLCSVEGFIRSSKLSAVLSIRRTIHAAHIAAPFKTTLKYANAQGCTRIARTHSYLLLLLPLKPTIYVCS